MVPLPKAEALEPLHAALQNPTRARGVALNRDDGIGRAVDGRRVARRGRDGQRACDDEHFAVVHLHIRVDVIGRRVVVDPSRTRIGNVRDNRLPRRAAGLLRGDNRRPRNVRADQCVGDLLG